MARPGSSPEGQARPKRARSETSASSRGGTTPPAASSINYAADRTRANDAVVQLGSAGDLAVRCLQASGTAHVVLDVTGYFE